MEAEEEVLVASFAKAVRALVAASVIEVHDFYTRRQNREVTHQGNALEEGGWIPSCNSGLAVRWFRYVMNDAPFPESDKKIISL